MRFKVGDRIKIVNHLHGEMGFIGSKGIIRQINESGTILVLTDYQFELDKDVLHFLPYLGLYFIEKELEIEKEENEELRQFIESLEKKVMLRHYCKAFTTSLSLCRGCWMQFCVGVCGEDRHFCKGYQCVISSFNKDINKKEVI